MLQYHLSGLRIFVDIRLALLLLGKVAFIFCGAIHYVVWFILSLSMTYTIYIKLFLCSLLILDRID